MPGACVVSFVIVCVVVGIFSLRISFLKIWAKGLQDAQFVDFYFSACNGFARHGFDQIQRDGWSCLEFHARKSLLFKMEAFCNDKACRRLTPVWIICTKQGFYFLFRKAFVKASLLPQDVRRRIIFSPFYEDFEFWGIVGIVCSSAHLVN